MRGSEGGDSALSVFEGIGSYGLYFRDTIRWMFRPPFDAKNIIIQMLKIGYKSIPVTAVTLFFTGMVMAFQIGRAMDSLMSGSSIFIGSAVTISIFRELCPVITGLLLAGRVGSSIAEEIGTMKVTEQIDALRTLAAEPVQYLSVPRFIACYQGFKTSGGAEGVGKSTMQAVLKSSMAILISNYFLTYMIRFFE